MTGLAAGLGLLAVLVVLAGLAARTRGVSPRVAAVAHLVTLAGWGLVPAVWLACLGGALGSWLPGIHVPGGGCLLGPASSQWRLLGYLPAAVALGLPGWHLFRAVTAARRARLGAVT
ncbi:MAG: hypothetical protein ACRDNW_03450, partial [Trebonia sp.]